MRAAGKKVSLLEVSAVALWPQILIEFARCHVDRLTAGQLSCPRARPTRFSGRR
jgi:hypothetical protein